MNKNYLLFSFLFLFILVSSISVTASSGTPYMKDWAPAFELDYYVTSLYQDWTQIFGDFNYLCYELQWGGDIHRYCNWDLVSNSTTDAWFSAPGYFNFTIYGFPYNDMYIHNLGPADFLVNPLWIEAWSFDGEMVGTYTHIVGTSQENVTYPISVHPQQIVPIPDWDLQEDLAIAFSVNDYFTNYNTIELYIVDSTTGAWGTLTGSSFNADEGCLGSYPAGLNDFTIMVCLEGSGDGYNVKLYPLGNDTSIEIELTVRNNYGWAYDTFNVTSAFSDFGDVPQYEINDSMSASFVAYITGVFSALYPSKDVTSTRQKFGYTFISFVLLNFLLLFGLYSTKSMPALKYLLPVLNIILVFYFFAIGYLPVSILIIGFLLLLTISYFKVRGG